MAQRNNHKKDGTYIATYMVRLFCHTHVTYTFHNNECYTPGTTNINQSPYSM